MTLTWGHVRAAFFIGMMLGSSIGFILAAAVLRLMFRRMFR